MSLLSEAMEECQMIDKTTVPDGYGGTKPSWVDGAKFMAAFSCDQSPEAKVASAQGVTSVYRVYTSRAINLQYHDVLKRLSDGKVFRVKSDGDDKKTPKSAGVDARAVDAEEWRIPSDG